MEQPDPVQARTRELAALQLGDQILRMCEQQARIEAQAQQIETLTRALDAAKEPKVGTE